jgi:hypothetical protein
MPKELNRGAGHRKEAIPAGLLVALLCVAPPVHADDWKLVSKDRGIEVSRREVPGSNIVAFKGTGTIDAPLWKIVRIEVDPTEKAFALICSPIRKAPSLDGSLGRARADPGVLTPAAGLTGPPHPAPSASSNLETEHRKRECRLNRRPRPPRP